MSIPNFNLLSEESKELVNYVLTHFTSSQSSTTDSFLEGVRTIQITEFSNLVSRYASANPSEAPSSLDELPELPANPNQWNSSHIQTAVVYYYGNSYTISEVDAEEAVAYIVEGYNNTNEPITWATVQLALQTLSSLGSIVIVLVPV